MPPAAIASQQITPAHSVMVYSLLTGSTLLRIQRSRLPQTFCRYRSFIAALERGKQGEPDRPSNPRTPHDPDGLGKTRREKRLERFGSSSGGVNSAARQQARDDSFEESRDERVGSPRSSRFGRVVPARGRDDVPSRFREERPSSDRDERPRRREGGPDAASHGTRNRGSRFDGERKSSDRYDGERKPSDRFGADRKFSDRFGGDRKPSDRFGGERKPSERFGGDRKPAYRSEDREPRRERSVESEVRPFRQERVPYTRDARPTDRDTRSERPRSSYSDRAVSRGPPRDETGSDRDRVRSERPERSYNNDRTPFVSARGKTGDQFKESRFSRPDSKGGRREQERSERYPHDTGRNHQDTSSRNISEPVSQKSTVADTESLPYTTAASEFIYGHSSVLAAIKANRRKLYNIYVHPRGANRDGLLARIRTEKLFPITKEVGDEYMRAMDKASSGRPHNGVILESSPLPVPPITELKTSSLEDESFGVTVDTQSAEDALVNGKKELYSYKSGGWRHPLILYVDGVVSVDLIPFRYTTNNYSLTKETLELLPAQPTF
jgi:21S rRNA (GM2251-2'-O)-methyltransferase